MTATAPTFSYPATGVPQGASTGVTVNVNPPIKWQTGNSLKWLTGNSIRWIKAVATTPDTNIAPTHGTPTVSYTGVVEP
jgi:hypothetical protein